VAPFAQRLADELSVDPLLTPFRNGNWRTPTRCFTRPAENISPVSPPAIVEPGVEIMMMLKARKPPHEQH
jgi:hypothetical protein